MDQETYYPRIIDRYIDEISSAIGAVVLSGAKAVGKTETCKHHAKTIHRFSTAKEISFIH